MSDEIDEVAIAQDTMIGDLIQHMVDEMKVAPDVWQKMNEETQADVIERIEKRVITSVTRAIQILASENRPTITATLESLNAKAGLKATLTLSKNDPGRHTLLDAIGEDVYIIIPYLSQYTEQVGMVRPDPDQPGLMEQGEDDILLQKAVDHVKETKKCSISSVQRYLRVGYNRAAHLVEAMERSGVVSPVNEDGVREVL